MPYLVVIIFISSSICVVLSYSGGHDVSEQSLAPSGWQDWTSGRSTESIHADPIEKIIVLLAQTSDVEPDNSHTVDYFEDLLFGNQIGSMSHYFSENSRGQVTVEGEVVGWLQLSKTLSDYDEDFWAGGEYGIGDGIEEALTLADNSVDYSLYDQNNDGYIDNLMVVFVGESDSRNGDGDGDGNPEDANAIWPISWSLQSSFITDDGVKAADFFVCTEECPMGTFAHEFGHNLGLPDLYDKDGSSSGVGFWSIMSGGNSLENPSHFDPWSKLKFGWVEPTIVQPDAGIMELTLQPVETSGAIVKVPISSTEYWLIEYRSNSAGDFDGSLPGSGVLIWHIDESVIDEWGRMDNDNEDHPAVKLVQADGNSDLENNRNRGDSGDYFLSNSVFNNRSNPSSITWYETDVGLSVSITDIDEISETAILVFSRGSAWFYDIEWDSQDTVGDGFLNQVTFHYDIDSVESELDVRVELEVYGADDHEYLISLNKTHTVYGSEYDDFEFPLGYYDPASGIFEIKAMLWAGGDLVDVYRPEHPIWFEYPQSSNTYDEWFETITFEFIDKDGDGNNETVRGYYEIASDNPESPIAELKLICFNQNDPENKATITQENLATNNFTEGNGLSTIGIIEFDLSTSDIQPGIIDVWASLSIEGDGREEVFAWPGTEFWWNKLYIESEEILLEDTDSDGLDDWLGYSLQFEHTWRSDDIVNLEFKLYDISDSTYEIISQKEHTLFVGPRGHDYSGGRDMIFDSFTGLSGPSMTTEVGLQLVIIYPDGGTEDFWYSPYSLSPVDRDGDGIIDINDLFPDNFLEWGDWDGDGFGDYSDAFPYDNTQWSDIDEDGYGDNQSGNNPDIFPLNPNEWEDSDVDGVGDNSDLCAGKNTEGGEVDVDGCSVANPGSSDDIFSTAILIVFSLMVVLISVLIPMIILRKEHPADNQMHSAQIDFFYSNSKQTTFEIQQPVNVQTQFVQPHPLSPDENLTGQIKDGYEWIEFPAQSGVWYYRDWHSRKWIKLLNR
jgi:M6 family metalloprotease-like protein